MNLKKLDSIINSIGEPKEKELLKRILDLSSRARRSYTLTYTDFIDPFLLGRIKAHRLELLGMNFLSYGGISGGERQMIGLGHEDIEILEDDFPVAAIKIQVKTGIGKPISHRDYLGAIMGLGIEREKIGDLIIEEDRAFVLAHADISDYIVHSLEAVSRYGKVTCSLVATEDIPRIDQAYQSINATVSSPRADAIFAAGFQLSRSSVAKLILAGRALCNGVIISQSSAIEEGHICTLRGHGKIKIEEIGSITRKGRLRVHIHRYI